MKTQTSGALIVGALVAFGLMATAAALFLTGDTALQRFAALLAAFAPITLALVAALRSDHAATQTNGGLDARIAAATATAVKEALQNRRASDRVIVTEALPETVTASTERPLTGP